MYQVQMRMDSGVHHCYMYIHLASVTEPYIKQKPQSTVSAGLCHMGEHNFMEMSLCCM